LAVFQAGRGEGGKGQIAGGGKKEKAIVERKEGGKRKHRFHVGGGRVEKKKGGGKKGETDSDVSDWGGRSLSSPLQEHGRGHPRLRRKGGESIVSGDDGEGGAAIAREKGEGDLLLSFLRVEGKKGEGRSWSLTI